MNLEKLFIWDIETYKHLFSFSIVRADGKFKQTFACSNYTNQIDRIHKCLNYLKQNDCYLVGFNNIGFDYPVLHELLKLDIEGKTGLWIANKVFKIAQKQIDSFKDGFGNTIKYEDQIVKQIDLFKVHHFDNKAKMTSLKLLEFNMRMNNLVDLPYGIESELTKQMIDEILLYNEHDVEATRLFLHESIPQVEFRFQLTEKYSRNFLNHNDGKIGKDYFQMKLEECNVALTHYKDGKKVLKQTQRSKIAIKDCLFNYYDFKRPEFKAIKDWFATRTITETKGVFSDIEEHELGEVAKSAEMVVKRKRFKNKPNDSELAAFMKEHPLGWVDAEELKATEYLFDAEGNHVMLYPMDADGNPDFTKKQKKARVAKQSYWGCYRVAETLNVVVDGLRIDFGVGGIHGSLSDKIVKETSKYAIRDADVSSMYPNIAISNRVYPEHLGESFCDIYQDVYEQRKSYPKGSAENAMLKLALNSVYGDSNNKYSVFYDPQYTMRITINGQLSLLLLAEKLLEIEGLKLVQLNTDGLTVAMLRDTENEYKAVCKAWEKQVGLELEYVDYARMFIRDVNNYLAEYTNGKVKRKGAYQYEGLGWHMNQSSLVIPMAAEAEMLQSIPCEEFIKEHLANPNNKFDFMLRTKVPRSSKLVLEYEDGRVEQQQNVCRYYVAKSGGKLIKLMPALEDSEDKSDRRLSIDSAWKVKTCNDMNTYDADIDLNYYVSEAKKLVITVTPKQQQ